jgi:hypothetical protein
MLQKNSLILLYPYNIFAMTDLAKSNIPSFYKHGEEYYLEGRVIKDDGSVFSITTTETGLETSRRWEDIYKVVVKLDGSGNPPTTVAARTVYAPARSEPSEEEELNWGTPESSESVEHYGGDKATDQANKGGYQTFALVGICAVGIYFFFK